MVRNCQRRPVGGAAAADSGQEHAADDSTGASTSQQFRRAYRLPLGFVAEFQLDFEQISPGDVKATGLTCEWPPRVPHIRSPRARRKFLAAYTAARDDFAQDLAQVLGGNVLAIDFGRELAAGDDHHVHAASAIMTAATLDLPCRGRRAAA